MILVINCMLDDKLADSFNKSIQRTADKLGRKVDFLRISQETEPANISGYSHVIVSGSEESATKDKSWDGVLETSIQNIVEQKIPLLGICYGHQFIARTLAGKQNVRRAEKAEMGWIDIKLSENPLFNDIKSPVCMVSHYDEAFNLPEDFDVIASSPNCGVHSYRYKKAPVWGVQFHPEYNIEDADEIFDMVKSEDKTFSSLYSNQLENEEQITQNERVLINFLSS